MEYVIHNNAAPTPPIMVHLWKSTPQESMCKASLQIMGGNSSTIDYQGYCIRDAHYPHCVLCALGSCTGGPAAQYVGTVWEARTSEEGAQMAGCPFKILFLILLLYFAVFQGYSTSSLSTLGTVFLSQWKQCSMSHFLSITCQQPSSRKLAVKRVLVVDGDYNGNYWQMLVLEFSLLQLRDHMWVACGRSVSSSKYAQKSPKQKLQ